MKTRDTFLVVLLCLSFVPSLRAKVFKDNASGTSGSVITIRWETEDESGVARFEVVRSEWQSDMWGPEEPVDQRVAGGQNSAYEIRDAGVFKMSERVLRYTIRALDGQGKIVEEKSVVVRYSSQGDLTSAARRTWGSIKAMFR